MKEFNFSTKEKVVLTEKFLEIDKSNLKKIGTADIEKTTLLLKSITGIIVQEDFIMINIDTIKTNFKPNLLTEYPLKTLPNVIGILPEDKELALKLSESILKIILKRTI